MEQEEKESDGLAAGNGFNSIEEIDKAGCLEEIGECSESATDGEIIGKFFNTEEDAYEFYNHYALCKGFGIRKHWKNKNKARNKIYRRQFVCNKQGFKYMSDKRRMHSDVVRRDIKRTGCQAMIQISLSQSQQWVIDKFFDEYNHPLDSPSKVIKQRSHNNFHRTEACKTLMFDLKNIGVRNSEITKIVNAYKGSQDGKVTQMQCSSILAGERKVNLGKECYGIIKHFERKADSDEWFYFRTDLAKDGSLKSIFWADGRSRTSYNQFGDVVVFDVTYKTNKFGLPFAPFVGVNHHGQTILFAAALIENEKETTFIWLFQQFLRCMFNKPPLAIITDQDGCIGKVITRVFPATRHRFCAWHIQKHVLEHLRPLKSKYDDFQVTYSTWVKSKTIEDFESGWQDLKEKYEIGENTWLANMCNLRRHWVKVYLKDTFFTGMTTSGRSESIHSFFDGYVNSKTLLNDFVVQYDKAVNDRRAAEEDQDFRTLNSKPTLHTNHPIEVRAAEIYTRNAYEMFKEEWKASLDCVHETLCKSNELVKCRVGSMEASKEIWKVVCYCLTPAFDATCSCAKFETHGILCKHVLYVMKRKLLTSIPEKYILPRWTIGARYKVGYVGHGRKHTRGEASKDEVSFLTIWSLRGKVNRAIEEAKDSLVQFEKLEKFVDQFLEDQTKRRKCQVEPIEQIGSSASVNLQAKSEDCLLVRDPAAPAKTKGRPKVATRMKSGFELAVKPKQQRTCSFCKGKGHYVTGCQKYKMNQSQNLTGHENHEEINNQEVASQEFLTVAL